MSLGIAAFQSVLHQSVEADEFTLRQLRASLVPNHPGRHLVLLVVSLQDQVLVHVLRPYSRVDSFLLGSFLILLVEGREVLALGGVISLVYQLRSRQVFKAQGSGILDRQQ